MPSSSLHTTVSVIVPTYRAERFVERCVESVLAQTFRDFELVIVDDGSADASIERLKRFLADDRVTLLSQPNHGLSCARNTGLRLRRKTSDFVYFLDADDFIHPELLEVCVRTLRDHPSADFALLEIKKCAACETPPWEALPTFAPRELTYPARKLLVPDFHYETLAVWRFFFRAESIAGVFFEPGLSYVEDLDFLPLLSPLLRANRTIPSKKPGLRGQGACEYVVDPSAARALSRRSPHLEAIAETPFREAHQGALQGSALVQ